MSEILKDYFYTGISFSTFFIDEGVFLCLKIESSKTFFGRMYYTSKLRNYLKNNSETDECLIGNEKYLVYQNVSALHSSSVLFSTDKKAIKIYRKLKNDKNALVTDAFEIEDMTLESLDLPITLVLKDESSQEKYSSLISKAKDVRFVYLNNIREETNREIIFDAIKVKLLQDETDIYFIEEGMYANYIANFIFTLNKIAIIY